MLRQSTVIVTFTFGNALTTEYQFRSEAQYFIFLLQHFPLSTPNIAVCQYCGRYFMLRTRKETKYCDRVIHNGKTCKQIAPYLNHKERAAADAVVSEYNRIKDMLLHRLNRADYNKKSSPIDLTREEYYSWPEAATDARDRYLAGDISEESALRVSHVPTIQEIRGSAPGYNPS